MSSNQVQCVQCLENHVHIHHVVHKEKILPFCTNCVLSSSPGLFCPICFWVYKKDHSYFVDLDLVKCSSCPSLAHSNCVRLTSTSTADYTCKCCSDPDFKFFNIQEDDGALFDLNDEAREDEYLAGALLATHLKVSGFDQPEEASMDAAALDGSEDNIGGEEEVEGREVEENHEVIVISSESDDEESIGSEEEEENDEDDDEEEYYGDDGSFDEENSYGIVFVGEELMSEEVNSDDPKDSDYEMETEESSNDDSG